MPTHDYCSNINSMIASYFKFEERSTNLAQEIRAGVSCFVTMSYILSVNPQVISAIGIPTTDVGKYLDWSIFHRSLIRIFIMTTICLLFFFTTLVIATYSLICILNDNYMSCFLYNSANLVIATSLSSFVACFIVGVFGYVKAVILLILLSTDDNDDGNFTLYLITNLPD